ncbi:MAG: GntR family transcriptional regulator [Hyphomicrobiaceae bacterium]
MSASVLPRVEARPADRAARGVYAGPLYAQLAAQLRERIRFEDWRPGMLIPSETDLAREYRVSVGTARKALEALEVDGWIMRKQGRGTFVADLARQQMERLSRLRVSEGDRGLDGFLVRLVANEFDDATPDEVAALDLADASVGSAAVVRMVRHYFRDTRCGVLERVVFPAHFFPGMETIKSAPLNLFSILVDDFSVIPQRGFDVVSIATATSDVAALLRVEPASPLLRVQTTITDSDGHKIALVERLAMPSGLRYEVELS